MNLLAGPFFAACLLMMAAGSLKALRPATTALALKSVGAAVPASLVRVGGATEAILAVAAIVAGGPIAAAAVAGSYAAFAGFVLLALRRGGVISSCGCFGKPDTPPTIAHIGVNVGAALVAAGYAFASAPALADVVRDQPLAGLPFIGLALLVAWLGYAVFAVLPLVASRRVTA